MERISGGNWKSMLRISGDCAGNYGNIALDYSELNSE